MTILYFPLKLISILCKNWQNLNKAQTHISKNIHLGGLLLHSLSNLKGSLMISWGFHGTRKFYVCCCFCLCHLITLTRMVVKSYVMFLYYIIVQYSSNHIIACCLCWTWLQDKVNPWAITRAMHLVYYVQSPHLFFKVYYKMMIQWHFIFPSFMKEHLYSTRSAAMSFISSHNQSYEVVSYLV